MFKIVKMLDIDFCSNSSGEVTPSAKIEQNPMLAAALSGNRLIFDFMGCIHSEDDAIDLWEMSGLKYNSSWDYIMPACKKFDQLLYDGDEHIRPYTTQYEEFREELALNVSNYEISPVFDCLVECIKWYNAVSQR